LAIPDTSERFDAAGVVEVPENQSTQTNLSGVPALGSFATGSDQQVQPCPLFADRYRNGAPMNPTRRAIIGRRLISVFIETLLDSKSYFSIY
jgi:hypothetical protein